MTQTGAETVRTNLPTSSNNPPKQKGMVDEGTSQEERVWLKKKKDNE